jgi:hypothetical protein
MGESPREGEKFFIDMALPMTERGSNKRSLPLYIFIDCIRFSVSGVIFKPLYFPKRFVSQECHIIHPREISNTAIYALGYDFAPPYGFHISPSVIQHALLIFYAVLNHLVLVMVLRFEHFCISICGIMFCCRISVNATRSNSDPRVTERV